MVSGLRHGRLWFDGAVVQWWGSKLQGAAAAFQHVSLPGEPLLITSCQQGVETWKKVVEAVSL